MSLRFTQVFAYAGALLAVVFTVESPLWASVTPTVPEIDGGSIAAGLGLLAAGVLMFRGRRSK